MTPLRIASALLLAATCVAANAAAPTLASPRAELQAAIREARDAPRAPTLPRDLFLRRAPVGDVQMAPDGRHLSYRRTTAQRTELRLRAIDDGTERRVLADAGAVRVAWSGDGRRLWLPDALGLAVYDVESASVRRIVKWDATRRQRWFGVDWRAPDHAIVDERVDAGGRWEYRYLRVDTRGATTLLLATPQPVRELLLDAAGAVVYSATYEAPAFDTVVRRHRGAQTREVLRCRGVEVCRLVAWSDGGDTLDVVTHRGTDRATLRRWSASAGTWRTLHEDPSGISDVGALLQKPDGTWLAAAYHPDRRRWHGRDARVSAQLAALAKRVAPADFTLASDASGSRWLVGAKHSTWQHDRHFVYAPDDDTLVPVLDAGAAPLPSAQLAPSIPIRWRASDGMTIHGYVHLPRGVDPARAPLVVMPHGGPHNRDRGDFDRIVQLAVNRGAAVLLPNFRASTTYGLAYMRAANGDYGNGRVLADMIEGLDVLIAEGIGDPNRQAIVGHSFGGYASLLAVAHHRERFDFAVAMAAPVEFAWGMQWIADNGGSAVPEDGPPAALFFRQFGMPFDDPAWRARMQRESPLAHVATLHTPVYLWAGAKDDRIPLMEIVRYAGDARRHERPIALLVDPDAGHSPGSELGLDAILHLIEQAAAKHWGSELTPPSPQLAEFLAKNQRVAL